MLQCVLGNSIAFFDYTILGNFKYIFSYSCVESMNFLNTPSRLMQIYSKQLLQPQQNQFFMHVHLLLLVSIFLLRSFIYVGINYEFAVWTAGLLFVTLINLCAVVGIGVMRYLTKETYNQVI